MLFRSNIFNYDFFFSLRVQTIDVTRCDFVSSSALASIASGHSSLEQINAGYCFLVSLFVNLLLCLIFSEILAAFDFACALKPQTFRTGAFVIPCCMPENFKEPDRD